MIDFMRVRELYHIALPETDFARREYVWALTGGKIPGIDPRTAAWLSGIHSYMSDKPVRDYLAFDARNADNSAVAVAETDVNAREFEVVRGRYDPDATRRSLKRCSEKCEPFMLSIHEGVEFYIVGKEDGGLRNRGRPPLFDAVGRGSSVAVTESHVYRTLTAQDMRDMLGAVSGNGRSLADDEDMALAAAALDDLGAYAGSIRRNVERFSVRRNCSGPESECVMYVKGELGVLLDEYEVLAVGIGKDEHGPFIGVTLIYADEGAAESNATVFEKILESGDILRFENVAWREVFPRAEVKSEGRVVIARLSMSNPYGGDAPWFIIYDYAGLFFYR